MGAGGSRSQDGSGSFRIVFGGHGSCRLRSLIEQQSPQTAQVIERTAAAVQMLLQFFQLVLNQPQCLQPPVRLCSGSRGEIGGDVPARVRYRLEQQADVFVSILDTVKRSLRLTTHDETFRAGK